jgi:ADP-dependent NAD(P)H-hydrate dehydratase / NAD(P)H-hydrate epimerase
VDELPSWLEPLLDAETMRGTDRWAISERGVPGLELMENAGAAVTRAAERMAPDGPVTVLCGKGNNGGDGLVVARMLRESGREVNVICVAAPEELTGDARANLECLPGPAPLDLDGVPWPERDERPRASAAGAQEPLPPQELLGAQVLVVDALLGTGFQGEPRGEVARAIAALTAAGPAVLSVDVPSGVDASTGEVATAAVHATVTVTFHAAKPGLWINPGKAHAGQVEVADIGIPRGAPGASRLGLISEALLAELPRRGAHSTKFSSGHVLLAGGSRGLTGAPTMAARASMRAGAGYVTACVPGSLQPIVASSGVPELMTRALEEDPPQSGSIAERARDAVLEAAQRGGALALGPGLGRSEPAAAFARGLARAAPLPTVIDADGLNAHAGHLQELAGRSAPTVLTPHAGELARLIGSDSGEIDAHRLHHVVAAAAQSGAVVALKGDDTLVASPDGLVAVSPGRAPGLATAGTGDVLTGVVAALLATGLDAFTATAGAVLMHVLAGRLAARRAGAAEGVIASDVIEALPAVRVAVARDSGRSVGEADG